MKYSLVLISLLAVTTGIIPSANVSEAFTSEAQKEWSSAVDAASAGASFSGIDRILRDGGFRGAIVVNVETWQHVLFCCIRRKFRTKINVKVPIKELVNLDMALHRVIPAKNSEETIKLLLAAKADIHARNSKGQTPLHVACFHTDKPQGLAALKLLLKAGADVDVFQNPPLNPKPMAIERYNPLQIASLNGSDEAIELLISSGAHPMPVCPTYGDSLAHIAIKYAVMRENDFEQAIAKGIKIRCMSEQLALVRRELIQIDSAFNVLSPIVNEYVGMNFAYGDPFPVTIYGGTS